MLIAGTSFAGLATAYWMDRLGYEVTVDEVAKGLKKGGTPVDIRGGTLDIVGRIGIIDSVYAKRLSPPEFRDSDDTVRASSPAEVAEGRDVADFEIERDALLQAMAVAIGGRVGMPLQSMERPE